MRSVGPNVVLLVAAVLALALGGPWLVQHLRSLPSGGALAARSGERIVTLAIDGMTCAGCEAKIRDRLQAVPGVSAAEVRHPQARAYVVCARDVADSTLVAAVSRGGSGYRADIVAK